jgi:hypothetical protein
MCKQKLLIIIALMLLILPQCKKYPDDEDGIHFRTAKERLCATAWCTNGPGCNGGFNFYSNGTEDGAFFFNCQPYFNKGNWEFIDHHKGLRITNPANNINYDFTIMRLEKAADGYYYMTLKNDTATFQFYDSSR